MFAMRFATLATLAALSLSLASAQTPAEFYAGKSLDLHIGYSVGGGYDLYARMLARHIGKYIPGNPTVVPKNMAGAGSLRLANWLYNVAPRDGTVLGAISRGAAFDPLLDDKAPQFDATKFTWIGSANNEVSVCAAWHTSGITRFEDLATKELTIGSTGAGDDTYQFARVLSGLFGAKIRIVTGYPGGADVLLAMERGEVQGRCGWSWSSVKANHLHWVRDKKIVILMQLALSRHPDLADVPLVTDLATTDEQRQALKLIFARQVMGRPYVGPPGIPQDRTAALRKAFMETMNDKELLADAEKATFEITPVAGDELERLVSDIYRTPPEVVKKAAQLIK